MSKIVSIASAVPAYKHQQNAIMGFADAVYCKNETDSRKLKYLYHHSGISTRYSVIPDYSLKADERLFYAKTVNLEPFPGLEKRMEWYSKNALPLSVTAINNCIASKITANAITHLITVSCTGMSAPGLDLEIMEAMKLPENIYRTSVNFMGCYAAIHALKIADVICKADSKANVVIVCTEFCTLHFQKENLIDNITATLLFGDGCAAVLVQADNTLQKGITLKNFYATVSFKGKKDMSWQISSTGFLMTLSGYVPDLIKEDFDTLLKSAFKNAGIEKNDVTHWCIHPGGKKILAAIEKSAGLQPLHLNYAYEVLNDYGNMSSPTILFVLQKIFAEIQTTGKAATIFGAAFGPGLTMETFTASYE